MQKIYFLVIFFTLSHGLFAQTVLKGRVRDEKNKVLSFVSVALQRSGKTTASTATDDSGRFEIPVGGRMEKNDSLRFSLIGYRTVFQNIQTRDTLQSFDVILAADQHSLANVTVTSARPVVTRRSDRYIINVENSFLANGNSGLEVLQRSPGIWVDNNGGIRIRGTQAVTVMINDVVQRMSGDELAEYLRTLKSEDIAKIEVIPNPPAEYEAAGSGGIVHIILKKARKDGLNGYLFGQYRLQGREPFWAGASSFDYKTGALYVFGGFTLVNDINNSYGHSGSIFADNSSFNSIGTRHNENARQQYRAGMSYEISPKQSITVQSMTVANQMHHNFLNDITTKSGSNVTTGLNETDWLRKPVQTSTNLLYTVKLDSLGSSLKFIGDYTAGSREEVNTFYAKYSDHSKDATHINTTPSRTELYALQGDYTKFFPNAFVFRAGVKYAGIFRNNHVVIEDVVGGIHVPDTGASNHFMYNENLFMGYGSIEKTIHKTSIKLGLRAEQTLSKGNSVTANQQFSRQYFGLFPSVFITQMLNEEKGSMLSFSYARRLERPGFNELNPYRLQLSTVSTLVGNPDLQPQYSHNIGLGYQFWKDWSASIYYTRTTGVIAQLSSPVGNTFENKYQNLDYNTTYGLNIEAPFNMAKGWMVTNSFSIYHADYTIQSFRISNTNFSVRHIQSIVLKDLLDIDAIAEYTSPRINANSHLADFFYMDLGFSKKILKGKARVRLYFSDVFNVSREMASTDYLGAHTEFYQKRQTQNIALSMSYNFSLGKKFNNKKIDPSNSEEKSRIGN